MSELRALIFDVDGTLAETERDAHRPAFNQAFLEAGLDWEWSVELYGELLEIGGGKERIRHYVQQYQSDFPIPNQDLDQFVITLHEIKNKYFGQLVVDRIPLRPGVMRLIQEAKREGVRLAIATTSDPHNVEALLKSAIAPDGPSWFEVIAAGDMVRVKKPEPDVYQYALQALSLQPEDCLAIEDSHQGLLAAQAAGLKTVITVNNYTRNQDFSGAELVLNSLGEPDEPFTVLSGNVGEATYFDLALARQLHQRG
ncbi:HAD family hydrolase [Laspinema sp. A4]|uniref:HAD family hydrolase n=1 Tax=Laspinema sp. D2d TaxID=2953686 RepID=UPI0021BAF8A2|nr:HAD family hydrolase [Laspinema sp. D2d]MCT7982261.1 HAD family hydrolase [Laspinema sp. D2d]